MLLQDIPEDNNLVIELSMNGQKYEFPSKVIRKVNQSVLVEPIRINGKILSFNSSGGGITVSVYMIRDSKPPMLWKGVAVNSIREDNGTFYKITANGEGFEVNRRGAFRLFIGISGVAQLGTNRKAVDVIVKDVSESGFSFVGMEDMDNVINMPVRLVFADFNQNYSLMGIIVRKVVIGENKIVYGCRLGVRNANLEQYISQKQRQMLSMNHGNSAFQNKEILEKALKEPGRTDRTAQEQEPDDKNYKKKQIKNDRAKICPKCGELMRYAFGEVFKCDNCGAEELTSFGKVRKYIEDHGPSNAANISDGTGVPVSTINRYLREGRIEIPDGSDSYIKCEDCGAEIRYGRYCPACAAKHNKGQNVGIFNSEAGEVPKHKRDAYGKMHTLDVMEKTRNKR